MTARPLPESEHQPTLGEIKSQRYQIVEWDGRCVDFTQPGAASERDLRTPQPIADSKGIVYVHLAGRPLAEQYTSVIKRADRCMEDAAEALRFRPGQIKGRRGTFNVINVGIASGTGNSVCPTKSKSISRAESLMQSLEAPRAEAVQGPSPYPKGTIGEQRHAPCIGLCKQ